MPRKVRAVEVIIDSNRKTCGSCRFLQKIPAAYVASQEWWCALFDQSRGLRGAQRTPNRSDTCLKAEVP